MKQQSLVRGYMILRRPLTESQQKIMSQNNLGDIVQYDDWWMAEGSYQCDQFWRIFQVCQQIKAKKMSFRENDRKDILKDLLHINFSALISINLSMNLIESIEGISRLNAPCLKCLDISTNNISEMKSFRKSYFPNLQCLSIIDNKIVDFCWLMQLLCSQKMNQIAVECEDNYGPIMLQNFSILFKLKPNSFKSINWSNDITIRNIRKIKMLENKYPGIKLDGSYIDVFGSAAIQKLR